MSVYKYKEGGKKESSAVITIGSKTYKVEIASSEEDKRDGLKGRESLAQNEGMLFIWDKPQTVQMTMEDTNIPLDQIFIDEDGVVTKVSHREEINDDSLVGKQDTLYVLEVNINSGIKVGDDMEFEDEIDSDDDDTPVMKVLAPDGSTQMELWGGERIVSRRETKILIKKAKKAYLSELDKDYKALGKYMFKILKGQDEREPEYVDAPS